MIKVNFLNNLDGYLEELKLQQNELNPEVVRVSRCYRQATQFGFQYVSVISTFVCQGQLFEAKVFCGEVYGTGGDTDAKTEKFAADVEKQIRDAAAQYELAVRPGVFEIPVKG